MRSADAFVYLGERETVSMDLQLACCTVSISNNSGAFLITNLPNFYVCDSFFVGTHFIDDSKRALA